MEIRSWMGINNVNDQERLKAGELVSAVDVDIDRTGKLKQRGGRERLFVGDCRSVFGTRQGLLFACGPGLYLMDQEGTCRILREDLHPSRPLSYTEVATEIFYSNGEITGAVCRGVAESWGVPVPDAPTLSLTPGGQLPPGKYRAVVTFYAADGRESGASDASNPLEFREANNALLITPPLVPDGVSGIGCYLSSGTHFFRVGIALPAPGTGFRVPTFAHADPLRTQFMQPPPVGTILRWFAGRVYVVWEKWLFYSAPAPDYHLFSDENVFEFNAAITMLEPVADGLFVSDGSIHFLAGADPETMTRVHVSGARVIPGSSVVVEAKHLGLDGVQGDAVVWFAAGEGVMAGLSYQNGAVVNLTAGRFHPPAAHSGAVTSRSFQGMQQLVASLMDDPEHQAIAATDRVSASVVMGGSVNDSLNMADSATMVVIRNGLQL